MAKNSVVWFEVMGRNTDKLMSFYGEMFSWPLKRSAAPGIEYYTTDKTADGIGGGIGKMPEGAGAGYATFYVRVDDVKASLERGERLGGKVVMPAMKLPDGLEIGLLNDPEGHLVGVCSYPACGDEGNAQK